MTAPWFSALRAGLGGRLLVVALALGFLWLAVAWAVGSDL